MFELSNRNRYIFYLQIFFVLVRSSYGTAQGCSLNPIVKDATGIEEDLLSDLRHRNLFGENYKTNGGNDNFEFEFSICADVTPYKPKASVTRKDLNQDRIDAIGLRNSTTVSGIKGDWILINFGPGDNDSLASQGNACYDHSLSSSVMMRCDRTQSKGNLKLIYEDVQFCTFLFELRLAAICGPAPGMSGWTVLFIILLVLFLVYFIGGVLFMRLQKGAKGVDQIPHKLMWFALGNKLADGCAAVCRCDQYCSDPIDHLEPHSPYSGGYSPIGEGVPATIASHNSERDAPMLNP